MANLFRPAKNEAQKTKFILSGIVMSFILMGYQNCGKLANDVAQDGSIELKPAVATLKDVQDISLISVKDEGIAYNYDVNVQSGQVQRLPIDVSPNDPSYQPVLLCLSEEQRAKLESILQASSVCFYQRPLNSDRVCTMQYIYPYAHVKQIDLGATNGCANYHDICSNHRDEFVKTVQEILATIDLSTCN